MNYIVDEINKGYAKDLIVKNHYSHKFSSCRYALGLMKWQEWGYCLSMDNIRGVAIYGYPFGRLVCSSISPCIKQNEVLELTRLWVNDTEGKNTESHFLSKTFEWIRKHDSSIKVLISYSDPYYDHLGKIYQATSWIYQGDETEMVDAHEYYVHGSWLHSRTCGARYGSTQPEVLLRIDPNFRMRKIPHKHRYIFILTTNKRERKEIKNTLKHPSKPYPKVLNKEWEEYTGKEYIEKSSGFKGVNNQIRTNKVLTQRLEEFMI